jgi:hypothetical protein
MNRLLKLVAIVASLFVLPLPAQAYLGPGGVVSGVGALLALVAAVVASLFGFVWFPLKRLIRRVRERRHSIPTGMVATPESPAE